MALQFDPVKGQQAAEAIVNIANGSYVEAIQDLYSTVKRMGEGNPIVDVPANDLQKLVNYFNETIKPAAEVIQQHFMEYAETAQAINNFQAASVADGEEVGAIGETTYDAAKNL